MQHAIIVEEYGPPDVMQWRETDVPRPGPGEVIIRHTVVGLNMIDAYYRKGLYTSGLPLTPGHEAAGVVEETGPGVSEFARGDRVGYAGPEPGAYCEFRVFPVDLLVPIPHSISDIQVGAGLTRALTAEVLLTRVHEVGEGEIVLVYAAAGGVGTLMTQWAAALGATIIGVVGNADKVDIATTNGCSHVLVRGRDSISEGVRDITDGVGVPVVYDSLGKDTFDESLDCLSPQGLMVSFGNATGPVAPFSILELAQKGSLFLTRPSTYNWLARRERMLEACANVFDKITAGVIVIEPSRSFPLSLAAEAHRALESGRTTGPMVLLP